MSTVINILDGLGRGESDREMAAAIAAVAPDVRDALAAGDSLRLAALLGARVAMTSFVFAPDEEPAPEEQPVETPDDGEQAA